MKCAGRKSWLKRTPRFGLWVLAVVALGISRSYGAAPAAPAANAAAPAAPLLELDCVTAARPASPPDGGKLKIARSATLAASRRHGAFTLEGNDLSAGSLMVVGARLAAGKSAPDSWAAPPLRVGYHAQQDHPGRHRTTTVGGTTELVARYVHRDFTRTCTTHMMDGASYRLPFADHGGGGSGGGSSLTSTFRLASRCAVQRS